MTDAAYTHLLFISDGSGSMGETSEPGRTKAQDTTAGIRQLLAEQTTLPGRLTVSLAEFRWHPDTVRSQVNKVAWFASPEAPELQRWQCMPYGGTPLLDAVGQLLTQTGAELAALPDEQRPARVVVVIATDGKENQSREYSKQQIREMIQAQREQYSWDIIFIGVQNADAFAEAGGIGVAAAATMQASASGTYAAYAATSSAVTRGRVTGQSVGYTDDERKSVREKNTTEEGK